MVVARKAIAAPEENFIVTRDENRMVQLDWTETVRQHQGLEGCEMLLISLFFHLISKPIGIASPHQTTRSGVHCGGK